MRTVDQNKLRELEALCIQEQPPECMSRCPFHVDGRELCAALSSEDFDAAATLYEKTVPFPGILSYTCSQHCRAFCRRGEKGGAIWMRALEEAAYQYGKAKKGRFFLPRRTDTVAVVGAGVSGLCAALELAKKGCRVTVFERENKPWGRLKTFSLPEKVLEKETARLFEYPVEIKYETEIEDPEILLEEFGAVYVAWGEGNPKLSSEEILFQSRTEGVFAGGTGIRREEYDTALSMSDGKRAAVSIDRFLKKVSMDAGREKEGTFGTTLYVNLDEAEEKKPEKEPPFTREEAVEEAKRCLDCKCLECVKACAFLQEYKTFPRKYLREVYNNLSIAMGNRHENRIINSCSLCGQCKAICPHGLDVGAYTKEARQIMVAQNKMPVSSFEFALRDLEYSNSDDMSLLRHEQGTQKSRYLFFPGCQMGASAPELVLRVYEDLKELLEGGVGLYLGCCGIALDWAGERAAFEENLKKLKANWETMGQPEVITACPTCHKIWTRELEGVQVTGIWELLDKIQKKRPILPETLSESGKVVVKDACGAREMEDVQKKVRRLVEDMGLKLVSEPYEKNTGGCCGFGGLTPVSNRKLADQMAKQQVIDKEQIYVTYCMNCRDRYTKAGAKSMHLLELYYEPEKAAVHEAPTWSKRQDNRRWLKRQALRQLWGEDNKETENMKLYYTEELKELLEERMILEEDIREVIQTAEESQQKIRDTKQDCFIAGKQIGNVHFWVYYREKADGYEILNTYSHRMNFR